MKSYLPVKIESRRFSKGDLVGGDAALDFINTVTGRDQSPRDWLDSYTRLLEWAAPGASLTGKNSAHTGKKGAEGAHSGCDCAGAGKGTPRNAVCAGRRDRFRECAAERHPQGATRVLGSRHRCARAAF